MCSLVFMFVLVRACVRVVDIFFFLCSFTEVDKKHHMFWLCISISVCSMFANMDIGRASLMHPRNYEHWTDSNDSLRKKMKALLHLFWVRSPNQRLAPWDGTSLLVFDDLIWPQVQAPLAVCLLGSVGVYEFCGRTVVCHLSPFPGIYLMISSNSE